MICDGFHWHELLLTSHHAEAVISLTESGGVQDLDSGRGGSTYGSEASGWLGASGDCKRDPLPARFRVAILVRPGGIFSFISVAFGIYVCSRVRLGLRERLRKQGSSPLHQREENP